MPNPSTTPAPHASRDQFLPALVRIAAAAVSGAVRAWVSWILDR
ncbi:hypothetical protein QFZ76_000409 [Streptomyces sp. V4I2]|nr:hypothetical protein [Streptomyces sp. V4I2]